MSNVMMSSVSRLCVADPVLGDVVGECCLCGRKTRFGFKKVFSNNFTGYSYLSYGDCLCEYCHTFMKNQSFRRKCWVANAKKVVFLSSKSEVLKYLLNPPSPPFVIYVTKSHQRQGWLSGFNYISFSSSRFYVHTDFVSCFIVENKDIWKKWNVVSKLREKGCSKTELLTGVVKPNTYKKALMEGWTNLLKEIHGFVKTPLWEVLVYVIN